jgi:hypothetical protein
MTIDMEERWAHRRLKPAVINMTRCLVGLLKKRRVSCPLFETTLHYLHRSFFVFCLAIQSMFCKLTRSVNQMEATSVFLMKLPWVSASCIDAVLSTVFVRDESAGK